VVTPVRSIRVKSLTFLLRAGAVANLFALALAGTGPFLITAVLLSVAGAGVASAQAAAQTVVSRTTIDEIGGPGISPRVSQRRTTGGDTPDAAAAWRTEVISRASRTTEP
jgi:hypothetical protein